jgi:hypothetical protein
MRTYSFILKIHLEMLIDERQNLHCHVSREWESFPCVIMLHRNRVIHPFVQNVYKRFNHAVHLSSSSHVPPLSLSLSKKKQNGSYYMSAARPCSPKIFYEDNYVCLRARSASLSTEFIHVVSLLFFTHTSSSSPKATMVY